MDFKNIFPESVLKIAIAAYVKSENFAILSTELKNASDDDLIGFLADHLRLKVIVKLANGSSEQIGLFIKMVPLNNPSQAEYISRNNFFRKENATYEMLRNVAGDEEPSPWKIRPLYMNDHLFIMEDLETMRGFVPGDRNMRMTLDQCYASIDTLAKFHAASFICERQRLDFDSEAFKSPNNFCVTSSQEAWVMCGCRSLTKFIWEMSPKYGRNSKHFKTIQERLPGLFRDGCNFLDGNDQYLNVLIHTDFWPRNFLMRPNDSTPHGIDVVLIDFQFVKRAPGALDLSIFLHMTADRQLRDEHEEMFLMYYREAFNREIGMEILSLGEVREVYERSRVSSFVLTATAFPYTLIDGNVAKELYNSDDTFDYYNYVDRSEPMIATAKADGNFGKRFLDIVEEFIERCVI